MFKIVILVHAITSGWYDGYKVGEFPSLQQCETERTNVADVFQKMLEERYSHQVMTESRCVTDDDST